MIHATDYQPRSYPWKGTMAAVQIDRLQDMTASITLNRTKIEEIGRDGLVDWRTGNPSVTVTLRQLEYGTLELPVPDKVFFLSVTPEQNVKLMKDRKNEITGEMLNVYRMNIEAKLIRYTN